MAIPPGSLVLITGVNGYIASAIASQLLEAGYRVRGTVRDLQRCGWLEDFFTSKHGAGRFSLTVVPDLAADHAFDAAMKDCSGIVHVAALQAFSATDPAAVIPLETKAALGILAAAAQEPSMKRVVLTSSAWAAHTPKAGVPYALDEWTFNEPAIQAAWNPPDGQQASGQTIFSASKAQTERAMWDWMKARRPAFALNTVVPDTVFGRVLQAAKQGTPSTSGFVKMLFYGQNASFLSTFVEPQWFVDVADTARLHVAALVREDVVGERLFAYAERFNWNDVLAALRRGWPEREFVADFEGLGSDEGTVPNGRAGEILRGMGREGWVGLEESVRETVESFLEE